MEMEIEKEIIFKAISWASQDHLINDNLIHKIYIFGKDMDNNLIQLEISDFCPYFYILLPESFKQFSELKNQLIKKMDNIIKYNFSQGRDSERKSSLINLQIVKRKKLFPYTANKDFSFLKLTFTSVKDLKSLSKSIQKNPLIICGKKYNFATYESKVDSILRIFHTQNIESTGFIKAEKVINNIVSYKNLSKYTLSNTEFNIVSYDIETFSSTGEFPNPNYDGDYIGCIGISNYSKGILRKIAIIINPESDKYSKIGDIEIIRVSSEEELLYEYCKTLKEIDPDHILGYNIWGFDDKYLIIRMKRYNIDINLLSRSDVIPTQLIHKEITTVAHGHQEFDMIDYIGRNAIDMLTVIRKDSGIIGTFDLKTFSLNAISKKILNDEKDDLSPRELFRIFREGTSEEKDLIAKYCIQDTKLVLDLALTLNTIINLSEMAKATFVPLNWLLFRGQQIKVFSLITKYTRKDLYTIPDNIPDPLKGYKGATVLEPIPAAHNHPVSGFDFQSLYPSIARAHNMCYTTIVFDKKFLGLPGVNYETVITDNGTFTYVQDPDNSYKLPVKTVYLDENNLTYKPTDPGENGSFFEETIINEQPTVIKEKIEGLDRGLSFTGIIPKILTDLANERIATRALQKKYSKDSDMFKVLEGKQLAIKITMNSVYGCLGAGNGMLPCKAIAASITSRGREMIEYTKTRTESMYSCKGLYGDSLPGNQYISVNNTFLQFKEFPNLFKFKSEKVLDWEQYKDYKEQIFTSGLGLITKTASGDSEIVRIIRHKTKKRIFRIKAIDSESGKIHTVCVTEGHSLIGPNNELIEAKDVIPGVILRGI